MAATYFLELCNSLGVPLVPIAPLSFSASRIVNRVAGCSIQLPATFDPDLIRKNRIIKVWRQPAGHTRRLFQMYFVKVKLVARRGGAREIEMSGLDPNFLLTSRIAAAFSGTAQAGKSGEADDLMKAVVTEMLADGVAPVPDAGTRNFEDQDGNALLDVQADTTSGPSIENDFAWKNVFTLNGGGILAGFAKKAATAGTRTYFDVVPTAITPVRFRFITTVNQRGQDITDKLTFSVANENLKDPSLRTDWTEEISFVYAGGQGEGAGRNIQQAFDATRYSTDPWGRVEVFADARQQTSNNKVLDVGNSRLDAGRVRQVFQGQILDAPGSRLGVDWNFGDLVPIEFESEQFSALINAVTVSVDANGKEKITPRVEIVA